MKTDKKKPATTSTYTILPAIGCDEIISTITARPVPVIHAHAVSQARIVIDGSTRSFPVTGVFYSLRLHRVGEIELASVDGNAVDAADEVVGVDLAGTFQDRIRAVHAAYEYRLVVEVQCPETNENRLTN